MGVLRGTITVRRFRITGDLPRDVRARFLKAIRAHAYAPIDPTSDEQQAVGWVSSLDQDDADLSLNKLMFGDRLVVGLRVDTLKAPQPEVKRLVAQRAREMEQKSGNPLQRRELRLLKATIERELRERILPRVRVTDLAWDLGVHALKGHGRLYLWSTSKGQNELFLDLFAKTFAKSFGLEATPEGPGIWARDHLMRRPAPPAAKGKRGQPREDDDAEPLQPTRELLFGFQGVRPGVIDESGGRDREEG
jgi:hypothetical protein